MDDNLQPAAPEKSTHLIGTTLPLEVQHIAGHLACGRYVRTINYHNTPQREIALYQRQVTWLSKHYRAFTLDDADRFFDGSSSDEGKPPILVGLFDGYRNNAEVFAPILETYGLSGWFLLVADFIDTSVKRQEELIDQYRLQWLPGEFADGRYAMTWDQAKALARRHVIVNHSATHFIPTNDTPEDTLAYEIDRSQEKIIAGCGVAPRVFCWLYGSGYEQNPSVGQRLADRGFDYLLGSRFEDISDGADTSPVEEPLTVACPADGLAAQLDLFHRTMDRQTIFDGIPALLPMYGRLGGPSRAATREDLALAGRFCALTTLLIRREGQTPQKAAWLALDVLAVTTIGKDFPFRD